MCEQCLPTLSRRHLMIGSIGSRADLPRPQVGPLVIRPRSDWAGTERPPQRSLATEDVRFLLVHHSAGSNRDRPEDIADTIRSIYDFHTGRDRGWPDIAYNFLIDAYGTVWEARAGSLAGPVAGDATGGNQGFSQLVCLLGDFTYQAPTAAALGSLVQTLAWLADRHGIDTAPGAEVGFTSRGSNRHAEGALVTTATIAGHRSMSQTRCPGDVLFAYVRDQLSGEVTKERRPLTTEPLTTEQAWVSPTRTSPDTVAAMPGTAPPSTTGDGSGSGMMTGAVVGAMTLVVGLVALRLRSVR